MFSVYELSFITDIMEEKIAKGKLRWLANFNEIHRDYTLGELKIPLYATGGLEEKGFFLSKIFSTLVTPKYKIHLLFCTSVEIDVGFLRKLVVTCKSKFAEDSWILIGLAQSNPVSRKVKTAIENIADDNVGVTAYSLTSKDSASSKNVLGKALQKHLQLAEAKFEAFDLPNYLKGFAIAFFLGTMVLIAVTFLSGLPAAHPVTLILLAIFSLVIGHRIYKTRYHTTLTLNNREFKLQEGKKETRHKWSSFRNVSICITPKNETCLRLYSKEKTLDLPLSRIGMSRKEAYNAVKQLIKRRQ